MTTIATTPYQRNRSNFLSNWTTKVVTAYLPRRIKRMIFLSSVTAMVSAGGEQPGQAKTLAQKLNQVLHIAYKSDSTILPMYVKDWIWKDLLADPYIHIQNGKVDVRSLSHQRLTEGDYLTIGAFFRTVAPGWLVYGSEALICQDLKAVFNQVLAK